MNKIYGYIIAAVLFVLAIFGYRQKVRSDTKEEIADDQKNALIKTAGEYHDIQKHNSSLSDNDLRKRLYDEHGRD